MDTIIVLLVLVLPTIFSLIGKKFEAAAKEGDAEAGSGTDGKVGGDIADTMKKLAEMFGLEDPSATEVNGDGMDEYEDAKEEPSDVEMPLPAAVSEVQVQTRAAACHQQVQEQQHEVKRHRETIDPKKLVIYSEIMKPKFLE